MKSFYLVTMGCAKNEVDSQTMRSRLLKAGYSLSEAPEVADCIIINTCSFIQDATEESLDAIFEAAGYPNVSSGESKIVVTGCMPARYGHDLDDELSEVSACVPCSKEDDIVQVVAGLIGAPDGDCAFDFHYEPTAGPFSTYVKISDGCDRFCSYCTIPHIRGRYHSFDYETIRENVSDAIEGGVKEIILIAQDTGRWGRDFAEKSTLAWLMETLAEEFSQTWFRVMYLQPEGITDELLTCMASHENICSYLDIPLQHVDADILKAMNRSGSRERFEQMIQRIRAAVPGITLRTTLIAGFPGETDEQFDALCDFVEDCDFDYIGVFAYSVEEGTKAAELPGQLDEDEKRDRAQQIRDLADSVCTARCKEKVGQQAPVLIEGVEEDGQLYGRAQGQAPEVDGSFYVDKGEVGQVVTASIVDTLFYEFEGEVIG